MPAIDAKNKVVQILIERDGDSLIHAIRRVRDCKELMEEALGSEDVSEVLMEELGLEPDYIFDIL